jgi:CRP-like cAMP-binding protein
MVKKKSKANRPFDAGVYLKTPGVKRKVVQYRNRQTIFSQGDTGNTVLYLQSGVVKITVNSSVGKEAVIALLEPGDFLGEGCISGQLP